MTNVLVVDDSTVELTLIEDALTGAGFNVETLSHGRDIVEAAIASEPDFIVLDIFMPERSGLKACEDLRTHPLTQSIPVIFLTADTSADSVIESLHLGCIDYICKPVAMSSLVDIIKRHDVVKRIRDIWSPAKTELKRIRRKYSQ